MELIVNVAENWGIGYENRLLVSIPADLRRFRQLTEGKTVILGRKTLETFPGGRPLKNRTNIVLTANPDFSAGGAIIVHSRDELLRSISAMPSEQLCVIGGASVYRMLLDYCDAARITKTYVNCKADAFFPNLDELANWKISSQSEILEENGVRFQYVDYVNLTPEALPANRK